MKKKPIFVEANVLATKKLSIIITDKIISINNYDIYDDSKCDYRYFQFNLITLYFK